MSSEPLITKYRPMAFDALVGHEAVINALQRATEGDAHPHAYLFTGPSGTGKTTIARILGRQFKCEVNEIDAASNSGVDAMRELVQSGQHMSLSGSGRRMFLVDECHALSRSAWQALLKLIEEPPPHLYWALCTTELAKVPETVQTRCYHVVLRSLPTPAISELVAAVADLEQWNPSNEVMAIVLRNAMGSPRRALTLLQALHDVQDEQEAMRIISLQEAGEPLIELCQLLLRGQPSWEVLRSLLERIDEDAWADAATNAGRYIAAAMLRAKSEASAKHAWRLLDALLFPVESWDRKATFYRAVGHMIWGG